MEFFCSSNTYVSTCIFSLHSCRNVNTLSLSDRQKEYEEGKFLDQVHHSESNDHSVLIFDRTYLSNVTFQCAVRTKSSQRIEIRCLRSTSAEWNCCVFSICIRKNEKKNYSDDWWKHFLKILSHSTSPFVQYTQLSTKTHI